MKLRLSLRVFVLLLVLAPASTALAQAPPKPAQEPPKPTQEPSKPAQEPPKGEWIADPVTGCKVWNGNPQPNEAVRWTGPCSDGRAHGQGTVQWFTDGKPGARYDGEYRDGKANGQGVFVWASGNRYEGEFRDDMANGSGTVTIRGVQYSGTWKDGCFRQGDRMVWLGATKEQCGF